MKHYHEFEMMNFLEDRKCPECRNDIVLIENAANEWGSAKFECLECSCQYELFMNGWAGFGSMYNTKPHLVNYNKEHSKSVFDIKNV